MSGGRLPGCGLTLLAAAAALLAACAPDVPQRIERLHEAERDGEVTRELITEGLADASPRVRATAASIASRLPRGSIFEALAAPARDENHGVRAAAATSLGADGGPRAVSLLSELVGDPHPVVRRRAIQSLGSIADPAGAPSLAQALKDPVPELRREAAKALAEIRSVESIEPLIGTLDDPDLQVRAWAARALGDIGDPRARPALQRLGRSDSPYDRAAAETALAALDEAAEMRANGPGKVNSPP